MKRLLLSVGVVALLGVGASSASAQGASDFERELEAFQSKAAAEKAAGGPAPAPAAAPAPEARSTPAEMLAKEETDTAPMPSNPLASPSSKDLAPGNPLGTPAPANPLGMPSNPLGGAGPVNPLGPAANLPLNKQLPATANALDMGMGVAATPEQIEAEAAEQQRKLDDAYFNDAIKQLLPMRPDQIRKLLDVFKESREASETPISTPEPKVDVETVSLDPSQTPLVIKTSPGLVTTLTILDQTGAAWPIQDVSWAGKFEVTPPEEGGHIVRITPQSAHGLGNISIRLVDLITPITFTLQTGLSEVYYRFDARIPKSGPLAKAPLIENGGLKTVAGGDENLVQVLDGTPPGGAEKLKVDGTDGRTSVWRVDGRVYLRTPLTLLSPAWSSSVSSADGMNVYVLNEAPILLLSDEGRMVKAHIAAAEVSP